jgi:hypothetical protein
MELSVEVASWGSADFSVAILRCGRRCAGLRSREQNEVAREINDARVT